MYISFLDGKVLEFTTNPPGILPPGAETVQVLDAMCGLFNPGEDDPRPSIPQPVLNEIRRYQINQELADLDRFIDRATEDLIEDGVIQSVSLSQYNQDRLVRKQALRDELAELK